jgi:hypothetical protein
VIAVSIARITVSRQNGLADLTSLILWGGVELSVGKPHPSTISNHDLNHRAKCFITAVILACLASFRTLYTASRVEKSRDDTVPQTPYRKKDAAYSNITDEMPLSMGVPQHVAEISSVPDSWQWTSYHEGTSDEERPDPNSVHVRHDFKVQTSDRSDGPFEMRAATLR